MSSSLAKSKIISISYPTFFTKSHLLPSRTLIKGRGLSLYSIDRNLKNIQRLQLLGISKGVEAIYVEIANEMKKCFRLKDMLNFNVL